MIRIVLGLVCVYLPPMASLKSDESGLIEPGAVLQKLAGDFKFTEGPDSDAAGNIFFTDQPNNRILKWDVDGKLSTFLEPAGRSNGMCFDREGFLWTCADEKNELWRIAPDGKVEVVLKGYDNKPFEGPNDIWFHPNGGAYFSDPYYQRDYWVRKKGEQNRECVYYLSPDRSKLIRVADDLVKPNGLVGTRDGKILYLTDIGADKTYKYQVRPDGTLSNKELFCAMGSDGMTIDDKGNVYLTNKGVTVFNPEGRQILHVPVPESWTGNLCFGGKDRKTLFITASRGFYSLRMTVAGASR